MVPDAHIEAVCAEADLDDFWGMQGRNSIDIQDLGWGLGTSSGTCLKTPNMFRDRFWDISKMSIELHLRSAHSSSAPGPTTAT